MVAEALEKGASPAPWQTCGTAHTERHRHTHIGGMEDGEGMSARPARNPAVRMLAERDLRRDRMRDANATRGRLTMAALSSTAG